MYGNPPQADNRMIKRQMTDAERKLVIKSFKGNQKAMMILAPVPILLFVVIVFISNAGSGTVLTVMYYLFIVIAVILCALILAMSAWLSRLKTKTSAALDDGTAMEVHGMAGKIQSSNKAVQSYVVGPITVSVKLEDSHLIHEGAQVSILCVPRLNIALSANGVGFEHGGWLKCAQDLEAMAQPAQ